MKKLASLLLLAIGICVAARSTSAQTKVTQLIIANANGSFKLNPPTTPASGARSFNFPVSPTGSKFVMSESTDGQTVGGAVTFTGPVTFDDALSLTFGGSTGSSGDVLTSDGLGGASWITPSGGGGSPITLTMTSPLSIGGGASADLSVNRTIAFDFSVPNTWTGSQTFPQTAGQGNLLINSINAGTSAIGVAQGGTGKTSIAANRLLLGNGTSAISEVGAGNDGDVLTLVSGVPVWQSAESQVFLPADTTNGTASPLQDISGLSFTAGANEVWEIEADLKLGSSGSNGITLGIDVPSGNVAGVVVASGSATGGVTSRIAGDNVASAALCTSGDQNHFASIHAYATIGSTGGTVQLKWGRGGSGTSTIYSKSKLKIKKL